MRIPYVKIAPDAYAALGGVSQYIKTASIPPRLRALVELRVSQINGCAFCVDMHSREARDAGETQQRLDCLCVWRETNFFDEKEQAALQWAEDVTRLSPDHVSDAAFQRVKSAFSDREIVDLTVAVAMMNAWNRMAISMRSPVAAR